MSTLEDREYYLRRARQDRAMARAATHEAARVAHADMADMYERMAFRAVRDLHQDNAPQ